MTPSRYSPAQPTGEPLTERLPGLALLPLTATLLFYLLPERWQDARPILFLPQALAYLGLGIWARCNTDVARRLGLEARSLRSGLRRGTGVGLVLGLINTGVILWLVPWLGGDIAFLRETPHARAPLPLMLPWGILAIAVAVELNFRGFLLGRLLAVLEGAECAPPRTLSKIVAVGASAVVFSFDPFMVTTFRHLHWIAVWDGLVWGALWVHLRNLYVPIAAHATEVMVMYAALKLVLA